MPLRTRIIIFVSAGLLVIGLISLVIILKPKKNNSPAAPQAQNTVIDQENVETAVKVGVDPVQVPKTAKVSPPTTAQQEEITVKNLARVFVERYHTYSSENNYQNIRDVQDLVTRSFWAKISTPLSGQPAPASFVSLTTEVLSISSVEVKKDSANVTLKVKKTSVTNGETKESYGDYYINLLKVGKEWLVSSESGK